MKKQHPRVVFKNESQTQMLYVTDVPAVVFDLQYFLGELSELEETKQCFGLTEPLAPVHGLDKLDESFWSVYGKECDVEGEKETEEDIEKRLTECMQVLKKRRQVGLQSPLHEKTVGHAKIEHDVYFPWERYDYSTWCSMGRPKEKYGMPMSARTRGGKKLRHLELQDFVETFDIISFQALVSADRQWIRSIATLCHRR